MRKILIVIDMQKDFIDGALGTKEAEAIVPSVIAKMHEYDPKDIWATRDTHEKNYLETQEGKMLPVPHCIRGTEGWQLHPEVARLVPSDHIIDKPTFGSIVLAKDISVLAIASDCKNFDGKPDLEVTLVGLCTDICVVSNALILKALLPEVPIKVIASCCAGVTPAKHEAALETMRSCQIIVE